MPSPISLTQDQIFVALGAVLNTFGLASSNSALPVQIVRGQVNRVPEPTAPDFVVLWPISRNRLATNIDTYVDVQAVGFIAGNVLTVTETLAGTVTAGQTIYGTGVAAGCQILAQTSGTPGGVGTYSTTQTTNAASQTLYCGTGALLQETEVTIQADVHGPLSADNAARIQTLFRDQFGVDAFIATGVTLAPLYTSDPRQMPFDNGEQQIEERWSIDLCMQANVTITVTQQFAAALAVTTIPVDIFYPVD